MASLVTSEITVNGDPVTAQDVLIVLLIVLVVVAIIYLAQRTFRGRP